MSMHPIDVAVGGRVRELRIRQGWSQSQLGRALGVSFQQVQKYERGSNRMGASRLVELAEVLQVPLIDLFADVATAGAGDQPPPMDKIAARVAREWASIPDENLRASIRNLIRTSRGIAGDAR